MFSSLEIRRCLKIGRCSWGSVPGSLEPYIASGFMDKSGLSVDYSGGYYSCVAMVYVLRGTGVYVEEGGRKTPLGPGQVFFRHPRRWHATQVDAGSRWVEGFVALDAALAEAVDHLGLLPQGKSVVDWGEDPVLVQRMAAVTRELRLATPKGFSKIQLEIMEMMRLAGEGRDGLEGKDRRRSIVERARTKISKEVSSRRSLPEILGDVGMSYSRLRSLFKEFVGSSPGEYMVRLRIEASCGRLQEGRASIKEIAEELGYPDAYTFSAQFKKVMGVSPSAYRKSVRGR